MMRVALAAAFCALATACTVGPDFERPEVAGAQGEWTLPADAGAVDLEPWRAMGDPVLIELIETAANTNLDLREAEARLLEARAGRDAAAGGRLPEAGVGAQVTQRQLSERGQVPVSRFPGIAREFSLWEAGFDASWELDLWGGKRRAVEAASARVEMAEAGRRETLLRVIAEVERTYAALRGAQAEAALLRSEAEVQQAQAALVRQLREAGEVAASDEADAEILARQAEAALPGVEARIRGAANILAVLTGKPPEDLVERLLVPAPIPRSPEAVAAGLRSDVLARRPDILVAEARLAAATAEIGVEKAKLFPSLVLIGQAGVEDRGGGDVFSGKATQFIAGPALRWPIFAGGRIKAQARAASARAEGAAAAYENAVLQALADSETAINRHAAAMATLRTLEAAQARSATSLELARARYRRGEDSRFDLLTVQARDAQLRRGVAAAKVEALQAHAALTKALGGGWRALSAEETITATCAPGSDSACKVADIPD